MDLKPLMSLDMGNQNLLEWVCAGEPFMDFPLVSSTHFPVTLPDHVLTTFGSEPSSICSFNAFYDPATMDLIPQDYYHINPPPEEQQQPFDDFNLDFLKWDNYIPSYDPIPTTSPPPNTSQPLLPTLENQDVMCIGREHLLLTQPCQVQNEGNDLGGGGGELVIHRDNCRLAARSKSSAIGFEEISKYFYMTITDAAKVMNVGLTVLKKRCRELGISRWPHRKMKSLKSLIQNVQELGKGAIDDGIQREIETLEEHQRLMEKMPQLELSERTKKLRQACFKANYKKRRAVQPPPYLDAQKALCL